MVVWRVYFTSVYSDEAYDLIHKHREICPSLNDSPPNDSIGLWSSYDSDPPAFQANYLRVLLTAELRCDFNGQVVTHRPIKLVEWIPRKAEDEAQRCQPRRIST